MDFCSPERKEEIGFGYEPDTNFDEYLLDFSPTSHAALDPEPTFSLHLEVLDEISSSQESYENTQKKALQNFADCVAIID